MFLGKTLRTFGLENELEAVYITSQVAVFKRNAQAFDYHVSFQSCAQTGWQSSLLSLNTFRPKCINGFLRIDMRGGEKKPTMDCQTI